MPCCKGEKYNISVVVYFLVIIFGTGSWIVVNGMWVELPLLVPSLPEGWALPSYLVVVIQLANVGPILYFIGNALKPKKINEVPVVYIIVVVGAVACFLLAFLWDKTTYFADGLHSTALLVLMFFLALVDCTSSIVFLPFMARLRPQYMTAYYIGEGFSGLIPSLVSLGQGAGEYTCINTSSIVNRSTNETQWSFQPQYQEAAFPPRNFYLFTFSMMLLCGIAFTLVNFAPFCKKEHVQKQEADCPREGVSNYAFDESQDDDVTAGSRSISVQSLSMKRTSLETSSVELTLKQTDTKQTPESATRLDNDSAAMTVFQYTFLLAIIFWSNGLTNGVLTSCQTYSTLPYGPLAYSLANRLSQIANPLACFVAFLLPTRSYKIVGVLTLLATLLSAYIVVLAIFSPSPPLVTTNKDAGAAISVTVWVLMTFMFSYVKVSIAELFRAEGRKALVWCGGMTQIGSLCGSVTMFVLVLHNFFKDAPPC